MQNLTPCLWFDNEAEEAVKFYTSIFENSSIKKIARFGKEGFEYHHKPEGSVMTVDFELNGQKFLALNGGPNFKFNPSISFFLNFDSSKEKNAPQKLDELWDKLTQGGTPLMPLDKYPFSERYGWIQDKYGLSWQLILSNPEGEERPFIIPSLMFVGTVSGKAEEASEFYLSVFNNIKRGIIARYPPGMEPDKEGTIMFTDFMIENQWFAAMDSAREHSFDFNESISFIINCETQKEIDHYWQKLTYGGEESMCGWLKDKFGISWQVVPTILGELMKDPQKASKAMTAMFEMKKFDINKLVEAANG